MGEDLLQHRLITTKEFAKLLGDSVRNFQRRKASNKLPPPVAGLEGKPKWSLPVVLDWISKGCPPPQ